MPLQAAKAFFTVTAGVIPGRTVDEYSKQWGYTSTDYEQDKQTPQDHPTIFSKRLDEAHEYAKSISNPGFVNWVRVEFMWV